MNNPHLAALLAMAHGGYVVLDDIAAATLVDAAACAEFDADLAAYEEGITDEERDALDKAERAMRQSNRRWLRRQYGV